MGWGTTEEEENDLVCTLLIQCVGRSINTEHLARWINKLLLIFTLPSILSPILPPHLTSFRDALSISPPLPLPPSPLILLNSLDDYPNS